MSQRARYLKIDHAVAPITLAEIMQPEQLAEIDILKLDLRRLRAFGFGHRRPGSAQAHTLHRRQISRVRPVRGGHVGDRDFGCFFAERLDERCDGILHYRRVRVLVPWPSPTPTEWHAFNEYVLPQDRYCHGLS
jgi:hypothetical protein